MGWNWFRDKEESLESFTDILSNGKRKQKTAIEEENETKKENNNEDKKWLGTLGGDFLAFVFQPLACPSFLRF